MLIRKASGEEMLSLWGYEDIKNAPCTARFFYQNITSGNAVFWALDLDGELIGELYVFLDLEDHDFADGTSRAYLCAFRVNPEYRGQGLGSSLMEKALAELKESGFSSATIGVASDEPQNLKLYRRMLRKSRTVIMIPAVLMRMDKLSAKKRDGGCLQKSCELMDSRLLEHRQSGKSLSLMAKPLIDAPQAFPLRGRRSSKARPDEVVNFESDKQSQIKKKRAEAAPRDDKRGAPTLV